MNKKETIVFGILISLIFLIANLCYVFAQPPTFHQFYGNIDYENGTPVDFDVTLVANTTSGGYGSGISNKNLYGFVEKGLFFVNNGINGEEINFYVYGILTEAYFSFTDEETTELNLIWPCGNGVFEENLGEKCDLTDITATCPVGYSGSVSCTSHCTVDYSACVAPSPSPSPPGPSGPSGSSTTLSVIINCTEKWICNEWSECLNGKQVRACLDDNSCGTKKDKPLIEQTCEVETSNTGELPPEKETPKTPSSLMRFLKENYKVLIIVLSVLIIVLAVFISLTLRKIRYGRRIENFKKRIKESG